MQDLGAQQKNIDSPVKTIVINRLWFFNVPKGHKLPGAGDLIFKKEGSWHC
jgi:hypothetical protein